MPEPQIVTWGVRERVLRRAPRPDGPNAWPPGRYLGGARESPSPCFQAGRSKCLAPRSLSGSARKGDVHPAMSLDIRSESGNVTGSVI